MASVALRRLRDTASRHALGLWFCGVAGLGAMRCWMKIVREGQAPWPPDLWPWIAGTVLCAATGLGLLLREHRKRPSLGVRAAFGRDRPPQRD